MDLGRIFDAGDDWHVRAVGCPHTVVVKVRKVRQLDRHLVQPDHLLTVFIRSVRVVSSEVQATKPYIGGHPVSVPFGPDLPFSIIPRMAAQ